MYQTSAKNFNHFPLKVLFKYHYCLKIPSIGLSCVPKPTFLHSAPPVLLSNTKTPNIFHHLTHDEPPFQEGWEPLVIPADDASDWHIPSSRDPPATLLIPNLILMTARVHANKQGCAQSHAPMRRITQGPGWLCPG